MIKLTSFFSDGFKKFFDEKLYSACYFLSKYIGKWVEITRNAPIYILLNVTHRPLKNLKCTLVTCKILEINLFKNVSKFSC